MQITTLVFPLYPTTVLLFLGLLQKVTTAVPSWDREADGGNRPTSSATTEGGIPCRTAAVESEPTSLCAHSGSRPSSAAFRSWIKARSSARSVVSAVSSARTLGMDDPELVHLQLEMESRRGGMSEATLARVCTHSMCWGGGCFCVNVVR